MLSNTTTTTMTTMTTLGRFVSKEHIHYDPPPSNIFDYNYQKVGLLKLIQLLNERNSSSEQLKGNLLNKVKTTLGLEMLPNADRVHPFFHLHDNEINVSFLYDAPHSSPWQLLITKNFGDLLPLYKQIYDLIQQPFTNSNQQSTFGNVNIFHNRSKTSNTFALNNESGPKILELDSSIDENETDMIPKSHHQYRCRDMQVAIPVAKIAVEKKKSHKLNNELSITLRSEKKRDRGRPRTSMESDNSMIDEKMITETPRKKGNRFHNELKSLFSEKKRGRGRPPKRSSNTLFKNWFDWFGQSLFDCTVKPSFFNCW